MTWLMENPLGIRVIVMTKSLVEQIRLENGLVLNLYNASRKIAGDRWQVVCIAGLEVPVNSVAAEAISAKGIPPEDLLKALGDFVTFEKVLERNFVDDAEVNQVQTDLFASMTQSLLPYLSRPEFPLRLLIRRYQEFLKHPAGRNLQGSFSA